MIINIPVLLSDYNLANLTDTGAAVAGEGPGVQRGPAVPGLDLAPRLPRSIQRRLRAGRSTTGNFFVIISYPYSPLFLSLLHTLYL